MTTETVKRTWYEGSSAGGHQGTVCCAETGRTVAVVYEHEDTALLAAAPELLQELKDFVSRWTKYDRPPTGKELAVYIRRARAAIAKAEGR